MVYLVVSIVSAFAIALTVYSETLSFLMAFAAYSLTGTLVLSSVLLSAFMSRDVENDLPDANA